MANRSGRDGCVHFGSCRCFAALRVPGDSDLKGPAWAMRALLPDVGPTRPRGRCAAGSCSSPEDARSSRRRIMASKYGTRRDARTWAILCSPPPSVAVAGRISDAECRARARWRLKSTWLSTPVTPPGDDHSLGRAVSHVPGRTRPAEQGSPSASRRLPQSVLVSRAAQSMASRIAVRRFQPDMTLGLRCGVRMAT